MVSVVVSIALSKIIEQDLSKTATQPSRGEKCMYKKLFSHRIREIHNVDRLHKENEAK